MVTITMKASHFGINLNFTLLESLDHLLWTEYLPWTHRVQYLKPIVKSQDWVQMMQRQSKFSILMQVVLAIIPLVEQLTFTSMEAGNSQDVETSMT